ncbi:phytolongin Phyl1.2-like [Curcuma longa]|uniref:phytolongin Phyl1.2-like n=1 Tax=Curcuma longa TaxID=136217 RepID=UPI003D9F00D0
MIPPLAADPEHPILYVCVARGTTVLAELSRSAADAPHDGDENHHLPSQLADQCLASAPRFHRHYYHTAGGRIYAFLMADPLVFFAIALGDDEPLATILLLKRIRDCLSSSSVLHRRCSSFPEPLPRLFLQEDFLPELRRMVLSFASHEQPPPPPAFPNPLPDVPLPSHSDEDQNRKKKNKRGKHREANSKMVISVVDRDIDDSDPGNGASKSAPKLWSQYVRKIILIDLLVCSLLLVAWILFCRGFHCISH